LNINHPQSSKKKMTLGINKNPRKLKRYALFFVEVIAVLVVSGCGNGEDKNSLYKEVVTPLYQAVAEGDFELVQKLVSDGADVNEKSVGGRTPLHRAVAVENDENVFYAFNQIVILEKTSKQEAEDFKKYISSVKNYYEKPIETPSNYFEIIKFLVSKGADVNATDRNGNTPLHVAAMLPYTDIVQFLVSAGADIHAKIFFFDHTPLHCAAAWCQLENVKYLVSQGADVNVKNSSGETPLLRRSSSGVATYLRYPELVKFLISEGAEVNVSYKGQTPLHYAAAFDLIEAVKLLVWAGADANVKNKEGHTPMDLTNDDEVIAFLKQFTINNLKDLGDALGIKIIRITFKTAPDHSPNLPRYDIIVKTDNPFAAHLKGNSIRDDFISLSEAGLLSLETRSIAEVKFGDHQ